jgi:hypothetical protein
MDALEQCAEACQRLMERGFAEAHGITKGTLKRARKELGVRAWKDRRWMATGILELPLPNDVAQ